MFGKRAKSKVKPKKVKKEEVAVVDNSAEVLEAQAFVDEILGVQKFLKTYDINRTSNLDTLLVRAKDKVARLV